jgi:hypothetical protein
MMNKKFYNEKKVNRSFNERSALSRKIINKDLFILNVLESYFRLEYVKSIYISGSLGPIRSKYHQWD